MVSRFPDACEEFNQSVVKGLLHAFHQKILADEHVFHKAFDLEIFMGVATL
jgi:hypothetical protein